MFATPRRKSTGKEDATLKAESKARSLTAISSPPIVTMEPVDVDLPIPENQKQELLK